MYRKYGLYLQTFCCCCTFCTVCFVRLYGEAVAAALIDTFYIDTGDGMSYRSKIAPYLGETLFLFSFIIALYSYRV